MLNFKSNIMKILSRLLMAVLIMPMAFVSCSEDDDDPAPSSTNNNNNNNPTEQFVYDVDGESVDVLDSLFVIQVNNSVTFSADEPGSFPKGSIDINYPDTLSSGTYTIGGSSGIGMSYSKNSGPGASVGYPAISGTLNIITNDPVQGTYEGSFEFTGFYTITQDSVKITNGQYYFTN
jgi:hypothetical protein